MQRLTRRLWTFSLSALAVAVILAALAVGLFRLVMVVAPGYRQALTAWVSRSAGLPVHIGEMDLVWSHWQPALDLTQVTIMARQGGSRPLLRLRHLQVGFPLSRLIHGDLSPDRLALIGLTVSLRPSGSGIEVQSAAGSQERAWSGLLARVGALSHVAVRDARVRWHGKTASYTFRDARLSLDRRGQARVVRVQAALPRGFGGNVTANATLHGSLTQPRKLAVEGQLTATGVQVGRWLKPYLRHGVEARGTVPRLAVAFDWQNGALRSAVTSVRGGPLTAANGDGQRWTLLHSLDLDMQWTPAAGGARGRMIVSRPSSVSLPLHATVTRGAHRQWQLLLTRMPLGAVTPWLKALKGVPPWADQLQPVGSLEQVRLDVPGGAPSAFSVSARLQDAGLVAHGRIPGVSGIDGSLNADRDGGSLALQAPRARLDMPAVFGQPLPLQADARVQWSQGASGTWQLSAQQVSLEAAGARVSGQGELSGAVGQGAPTLNIKASFSAGAIKPLLPYVPRQWPPPLRRWLHQAFRAGRVSNGQLVLQGPLSAFPYPGKAGLQKIAFDVSGGDMHYKPGWPPVRDIDAHVVFSGRSLHVTAGDGRMLGVALGPVTAKIPDFRSNVLTIRGRAHGDSGRELDFLRQSPLRQHFRTLLEQVRLSGPASLQIDLTLPLKDIRRSRFRGQADMGGVKMTMAHWPHPLTHIRGRLQFDRQGVSASGIRARMLGEPLKLDLRPQRDARGRVSTRVQAVTDVALPKDAQRLRGLLPPFVLSHLRGRTALNVALTVGGGIAPSPIFIQSQLRGMAVTLPPPLGKAAGSRQSLAVRVVPLPADRVAVRVDAPGRLSAALRVRSRKGREGLIRGTVRLGAGTANLPEAPGLWIRGALGQVDAVPWLALLNRQFQQKGAGDAGGWLGGADLQFSRVSGYSQSLHDVHATLRHDATRWTLKLDGPDAVGTLQWLRHAPPGRRLTVDAEFKRLRLHLPKLSTKPAKGGAAPFDPTRWTGLRLVCHHCYLDKLDLGSMIGEAKPVAGGLSLSSLSIDGKDMQGQVSGKWLRTSGQSHGSLHAMVTTSHLGRILRDLGYAESINANSTRLDANFKWLPRASGLGLSNLTGTLNLDVRNGTLPTVDPGASRVLGLFNFSALPRRLLFNFKDVVGTGLSFDRIHGTFRFLNGNALTRGVKLTNPSMRMEMRGRVGLLARDYDEEVTIHPQVGGSLPIAGAVLGGPVVGALVFLAQQLLNKPLDQVSTIRYHLGGTWSNPEITKR